MRPVMIMAISAFLYSLFPLVGVFTAETSDPFFLAALGNGFSFIVTVFAIFAIAYLLKRDISTFTKRCLAPRLLYRNFLNGGLNGISHGLVFLAMQGTDRAPAALIYDSWPLIAAVIIPFFVGSFHRITIKEISLMSLSFLGIITVYSSSESSFLLPSTNYKILVEHNFSLIVAFGAAVTMAISSALVVQVQTDASNDQDHTDIVGAILAVLIVMCIARPITTITPFLIGLVTNNGNYSLFDNWQYALTYGAIIKTGGSIAYVLALYIASRTTKNTTVLVTWYLSPILTLIWFNITGTATITETVILGGILIIVGNILSQYRGQLTSAYIATVFMVALSCIYCFFIPGVAITNFYDLLGVIATFFAIVSGFTISRLLERRKEENNAILALLDAIDDPDKNSLNISQYRPQLIALCSARTIDSLHDAWKHLDSNIPKSDPSRKHLIRLVAARSSILEAAIEVSISWLLGAALVLLCLVFRTNQVVDNIISPIIASAVVFIIFMLYDEIFYRENDFAYRHLMLCGKHPEEKIELPAAKARLIVTLTAFVLLSYILLITQIF